VCGWPLYMWVVVHLRLLSWRAVMVCCAGCAMNCVTIGLDITVQSHVQYDYIPYGDLAASVV
jgi:hypothetical protein